MKKRGHYCKVCGEYKANEKFSGKGHAAHICKKCASLPLEERNKQILMTRLLNLPWQLSKDQISWLKKLQKDRSPEISTLAHEVFQARFPFAERNEKKKQLHLKHLELSVNGEMYDEYGDEYVLQAAFSVDQKRSTIQLRQEGLEQTAVLPSKKMSGLLHWMVNNLEIFCWDEDYALTQEAARDEDMAEDWEDADEADDPSPADGSEQEASDKDIPENDPVWSLSMEYTNGTTQTMVSYTAIHDRLSELIDELLSYFRPEDMEDEDEWNE